MDLDLSALVQKTNSQYLDLGCTPEGAASIVRGLGLTRGLSIDANPDRIAKACSKGFAAIQAHPESLAGIGEVVEAITLVHYLHTLPSRRTVAQTLRQALASARRAVLVVQPYFDATPTLFDVGLKLFPADRSRSVTHVTRFDIWQAFRKPLAEGGVSLTFYGRKPFNDSSHPAVVLLDAPPELSKGDVDQHRLAQTVRFHETLFEELVAVVVKHDVNHRPCADAEAIVAAFGGCKLLNTFAPQNGPRNAGLGGHSPATVVSHQTSVSAGDRSSHILENIKPVTTHGSASEGHLFVCGVPRSGTTALARMLNSHPKIGLGIERFRLHAMRHKKHPYEPSLFEKERFFDFRPEDGSLGVWEKYAFDYLELESKWDQITWVGDKVPRLYVAAENLLNDFTDARIIFILRDPLSVANSWQRRADDVSDASWPAENGWAASIAEFNLALGIAMRLSQNFDGRFTLVHYDDVFKDDLITLSRLFSEIGLKSPRGLMRRYRKLLMDRNPPSSLLSDEAIAQIVASSDQLTMDKLRKLCL